MKMRRIATASLAAISVLVAAGTLLYGVPKLAARINDAHWGIERVEDPRNWTIDLLAQQTGVHFTDFPPLSNASRDMDRLFWIEIPCAEEFYVKSIRAINASLDEKTHYKITRSRFATAGDPNISNVAPSWWPSGNFKEVEGVNIDGEGWNGDVRSRFVALRLCYSKNRGAMYIYGMSG